ncbi:hypothetical protein PR048_021761 [Dryococelus australis]|uniref:Uncharacterized protein n=1 Tax=Dryococelus australis TaxID=614101 RepID=A0ABQ9GZ35_9NEOP|nr:hypothetical protein PR048_021761 [Dryococelus australis]
MIEVSMEQRRNERVEETGDPQENPPTNDIVRHDSHIRKSGVTPAGYLKAVHDKVSTFKTKLRKKATALMYILTGARSKMRLAKLVTVDGMQFHVLMYLETSRPNEVVACSEIHYDVRSLSDEGKHYKDSQKNATRAVGVTESELFTDHGKCSSYSVTVVLSSRSIFLAPKKENQDKLVKQRPPLPICLQHEDKYDALARMVMNTRKRLRKLCGVKYAATNQNKKKKERKKDAVIFYMKDLCKHTFQKVHFINTPTFRIAVGWYAVGLGSNPSVSVWLMALPGLHQQIGRAEAKSTSGFDIQIEKGQISGIWSRVILQLPTPARYDGLTKKKKNPLDGYAAFRTEWEGSSGKRVKKKNSKTAAGRQLAPTTHALASKSLTSRGTDLRRRPPGCFAQVSRGLHPGPTSEGGGGTGEGDVPGHRLPGRTACAWSSSDVRRAQSSLVTSSNAEVDVVQVFPPTPDQSSSIRNYTYFPFAIHYASSRVRQRSGDYPRFVRALDWIRGVGRAPKLRSITLRLVGWIILLWNAITAVFDSPVPAAEEPCFEFTRLLFVGTFTGTCVCNLSERYVNLRNRIVVGCEAISYFTEIPQRIQVSMQRRVVACVRADGGHFEHLLYCRR